MAAADVIVVGAGPTGLMAAAELMLAGARPMVLDALTARNPMSRAGVIHCRTAELFDQRGLLEPLLATGDYPTTEIGHFAGLPVDYRVTPTRHPAYNVPQGSIEQLLEARLVDAGVPVFRGHRVVDMTAEADRVTVTANAPDGVVLHRGRYLVAADGGRSTIRKILGLDFPGRQGSSTAITAEAVLAGRTRQGLERSRDGHWVIQFPLEAPVRRLVAGGPGGAAPRDAEVSADELRMRLRAVYGDEVELVALRRAARIDDSARQITSYRVGQVFFAGDAAHIHLPLAGQGLNTGLGDAVNLGWKLAAAVHGWAPKGLLDTYQTERHPVGARVLANTQTQGLLMDWAGTGNADLPAVRGLLAELLRVPEAMGWLAGMMTGLDIRYDIPGGSEDPLVGMRMPDLDLTVAGEHRRSHSLMHTGRGLLLDLTSSGQFSDPARAWADRVDHVRAKPHEDVPSTAMLVRPDGHVCWTSGPKEVEDALRSWFGAPAT
ncbi:FAD-dependent monooxygenase [Actinomadura opuntiae]|uniref:FAD-dependent monooxygenase n=1 Tax=Actinomadura sp. OS1-43 TaxID=604315 RepID=UPI00255B1A17|nr:FAD-dependent monooxygenase [Actinomadura sp. OS1-43]MDL4814121.1 FAD-dependent monooxygenase [Actinomadura sp. OS1-43]